MTTQQVYRLQKRLGVSASYARALARLIYGDQHG